MGDGDIALEKDRKWGDKFDIGVNILCDEINFFPDPISSGQIKIEWNLEGNFGTGGTVRVVMSISQNGLGMRIVERAISSSISKPNNFL